jgi:hypothetical protein
MTCPRCHNAHITIRKDSASCDCCLHWWKVSRTSFPWIVAGITLFLWFWLTVLLAATVGCATPKANPIPAPPERAVSLEERTFSQAILPPRNLTLTWEHPQLDTVVYFQFYIKTNLVQGNWQPYIRVPSPNLSVVLVPTNQAFFLINTAVGIAGLESIPNIKTP